MSKGIEDRKLYTERTDSLKFFVDGESAAADDSGLANNLLPPYGAHDCGGESAFQ